MRHFSSGAIRDTDEGKLSYAKCLSPAVLRRYLEYMNKHRKQADGEMRDWDNWKNGIPIDAYIDSLVRHVWDLWLFHAGYGPNEEGAVPEDLLCAIMFNSMGYLFELVEGSGTLDYREGAAE